MSKLFSTKPTNRLVDLDAYKSSPTISPNEINNVIKLDANENRNPLSNKSLKNAKEILKNSNLSIYPNPFASEIKEKINNFLDLNNVNIVLGNGSEEIIRCAFEGFVCHDQSVVIPAPSFILFRKYADLFNVEPIEIQIAETKDMFNYVAKNIISEAHNHEARMAIICSPNNPTGNSMSDEDLQTIVENLPDTLILVDQVYEDPFGKKTCKLIENYDNILLVRSFSKRIGLAGIRLGFGIGSSKIINIVDKLRLRYGVNQITQAIAIGVLDDYAFYQNSWKKLAILRDNTISTINKISNCFKAYNSDANFFLLRAESGKLHNSLLKKLDENKIFVKNLKPYHHTLSKHCRVSITTKYQMKKFIDIIKTFN